MKGIGSTEMPSCSASAWEIPLFESVTIAVFMLHLSSFSVNAR